MKQDLVKFVNSIQEKSYQKSAKTLKNIINTKIQSRIDVKKQELKKSLRGD